MGDFKVNVGTRTEGRELEMIEETASFSGGQCNNKHIFPSTARRLYTWKCLSDIKNFTISVISTKDLRDRMVLKNIHIL